jgi:hypothetical protein
MTVVIGIGLRFLIVLINIVLFFYTGMASDLKIRHRVLYIIQLALMGSYLAGGLEIKYQKTHKTT